MANNTITLDLNTARVFLEEIESFRKALSDLRQKIVLSLPEKFLKEGTNLWWEREVLEGDEEIKRGKYKVYKSAKTLIADLHKET